MNTYKMFTELCSYSLIEFESNKDFSADELERIAKDVLFENKTTVGENPIFLFQVWQVMYRLKFIKMIK